MLLDLIEHVLFATVVAILLGAWARSGLHGVIDIIASCLQFVPGYRRLVSGVISGQVKNYARQLRSENGPNSATGNDNNSPTVKLPQQGVPQTELLNELQKLAGKDDDPAKKRLFAYVYTSNDQTFDLQKKAYALFEEKTGLSPDHDQLLRLYREAFLHENALNPAVFPALRRFETEIVSMTASMLNGDGDVVGCLTSGGTESLLMAMKTYRDRARDLRPRIRHPEMVAPITIHPAHEKAAQYFGFNIVHVPVGENGMPDIKDYENAITDNTIALLTSAPQYCHGVVDPIPDVARLAERYDLPLHVDACFGGFMLPWVEKLGYPVTTFDFRLKGVTSISADIHKYGFGCKGASVLLYRNESYRQYQIFAYSKWPGGLFGSVGMAGTRPGGNIAAAWVTLKALGEDGYMKVAKQLMETTCQLKKELSTIAELRIVGQPQMTCFALASNSPEVDIMAVADVMEKEENGGWTLERQQVPPSLHFSVMPHHVGLAEQLVADFRNSVDFVKANKDLSSKGSAGMYGMMSRVPDKTVLDEFIVQFFGEMYKL